MSCYSYPTSGQIEVLLLLAVPIAAICYRPHNQNTLSKYEQKWTSNLDQKMTDCVVVGGGLIGLLTARELANEGLNITLIDKAKVGQEASWAGGGILCPLIPWQYPEILLPLVQWGQQYYPGLAQQLCDETGIDSEWIASGMLMLDVTDHQHALDWAQQHSIDLTLLDDEQLRVYEPHVENVSTALCMPHASQIRNPRLVKALRQSLLNQGVDLREHVEVKKIRYKDGQVFGVMTSDGLIDAENVVIASGAWSGGLLNTFDMSIDIVPVRGQMLLYKLEPGYVSHILMQHGHYIIPRRDGHILVGSTIEYVGFDKSITDAAVDELREFAVGLLPELGKTKILRQWAGLRPGLANDLPIIGEHPQIKGLYINTGHFRNGILLAPASARLLADILLKRTSFVDAPAFAIPESS